MTLTFDLVTLTLPHLKHCINMNTMYKVDEDTIICSWFIAQTIFSYSCIYDLDLWPCDLDLRSTWLSHWYQCYCQVPSRSKHPSGIYRRKHSMLTYTHTHRQTDTGAYRVALQLRLDATKKTEWEQELKVNNSDWDDKENKAPISYKVWSGW